MASECKIRHTVEADISVTIRTDSSRDSSAKLHRDSGTPVVAGSSHANALTSATTKGGNTRRRPERFRSVKPAMPSSKKRLRQVITVLTATPRRCAITAFSSPSAAANTIRARTTIRRSAVCLRANDSNLERSCGLNSITNGLRLDTPHLQPMRPPSDLPPTDDQITRV